MKNIYLDNNLRNNISSNNLKNYKKYDKKIILEKWDNFIHSL
jgi:argonaute-like protein implicated in RNA metabolism and viral defense